MAIDTQPSTHIHAPNHFNAGIEKELISSYVYLHRYCKDLIVVATSHGSGTILLYYTLVIRDQLATKLSLLSKLLNCSQSRINRV